MTNEDKNKKSIQDKLATIKYNCDSQSHLILDKEKCARCKDKVCTKICPAKVYEVDEYSKDVIVQYENCLECGACRIACPKKAIDWNYPSSGCGVIFKNN